MKNTCKIYEENGVRYQFASKKLLMQINQKKHNAQSIGEKLTKAKIMNELAEQHCVSVEAVKNWMYGYNGPSDMEQVIKLGKYFDIDYHELLEKEEEEMAENTKITGIVTDWQAQYTKDKIREIYRAILSYIDSAGFYYRKLNRVDEGLTEEEKTELIGQARPALVALYNNAFNTLESSMLDIPEDMYEKIEEYFWLDLSDYIDLICGSEHTVDEEMEPDPDIDIEQYEQEAMIRMVEFFGGGYRKELRQLFEDYIVK